MSETPQDTGQTVEELQARNDELRAQLEQANTDLQAKLDASRAATTDADGLTDEDLRRLEHPEEFAHETATPAAAQTEQAEQTEAPPRTEPAL